MSNRDEDLAREIRTHLELESEERVADGASPDEARYAAQRAFGNVTRIREDARAVWIRPWIEQAGQDLRYATRMFARSPGFTFVAVVALALGIGANTAIFTVVNAVLLRPLPFPDSDGVVRIFENIPPPDGVIGAHRRVAALTLSEIATFASQSTTLSHVGGYIPAIRTLTSRDEPVRLIGARVSPGFLSMMGAPQQLGRLFGPHEDAPGADAVVILSHGTWHRYFAGDPKILGQPVDLDGRTHTVVGVMRAGFSFPDPQDEFWIPLTLSGPLMGQRLGGVARLNDGVSAASVVAELEAIVPPLRGESTTDASPRAPGFSRFDVVRLRDVLVAPVRPALLVLTVAVALVLLIACVNVANLLLARTAARQREVAVRLALGAGRPRLIRQALTESTLLAVIGGVAGGVLAVGGVRLLQTLAATLPRRDLGPGIGIPRLDEVVIDGSVFVFALAASMLTGLMCGVIPAIRQSGPRRSDAFRQSAAFGTSGFNLLRGNRTQGVLVVAEIAMAMSLLVGGGLLIHSFVKLAHVNPGYDPNGVLTFQASLPPGRQAAHLRTLADSLVERVRSLPDVRAAGYAESLPLTRVSRRFVPLRTTAAMPEPLRPPAGPMTPDYPDTQLVSREFLAALAVPVVAGRAFGDSDRPGEPQAMLINQTLARSGRFGENPIGKQVYALGDRPWEIIGIVEDVRQSSLMEGAVPQVFMDFRQVPADEPITGIGLYVAIRTDGDPRAVAPFIRSIIRELDSQAMVENVAPMTQLVSSSMSRARLYAVLLGLFACVAVALAATGIYGVMAYAVAQSTREIGIRMALGAGRARVMRLVLGQSAVATLAGIVLGFGGAAALTRYLDHLLFGLTPLDPATFFAVGLLFAAIATIAAFVPARRAASVDPLEALRCE